jgi:cation-transporting P-type ATPase C
MAVSCTGIAVVADSARLTGHTPHPPSDAAARLRAVPLEERRVH